MIKIYNLRDFGVIADGTTLCTKALQKAVVACSVNGGGIVGLIKAYT